MNDLLEKYWDGDTTLEEEQALRDYFHGDQVLPEHEMYRVMFQTYKEERSRGDEDFDAFAKVNKTQSQNKQFTSTTWKSILVAASVSLFVALGVGYYNQGPMQDLGTYEDPEKAYEATLAALELVSNKFNKGKNNLQPLTQINKQTAQVFNINQNKK